MRFNKKLLSRYFYASYIEGWLIVNCNIYKELFSDICFNRILKKKIW